MLCIFLADAAGIAIYEQIRENANVALYAKMAYTDMMTGLKNRAAFIDDSNRDAHTPGAVSAGNDDRLHVCTSLSFITDSLSGVIGRADALYPFKAAYRL